MQILTDITLNLKRPNINTIIHAKQNDRLTRKITAQLMNGDQPWAPPTSGILTAVRFTKPDGHSGFYQLDEQGNPAVSFSSSVATIMLAEQALTCPGNVVMELNIYTQAGEKLTSFAFLLAVEASSISDEEIISTDYFNVLTAQITSIIGRLDSIAGLTATAQSIPHGQQTHVEVTGGTGTTDPYLFKFYVEQGAQGETGPTGAPATVISQIVAYAVSTSGTAAPTTGWQGVLPEVPAGQFLWTRVTVQFNTGNPITIYSVSRYGIDGTGAVSTVDNVAPDANGNVNLGAYIWPEGGIPATDLASGVTEKLNGFSNPNLIDNAWFTVNQRNANSYGSGYGLDRWIETGAGANVAVLEKGIRMTSGSAYQYIHNRFEANVINQLVGKTVTASIMFSDGSVLSGSGTVSLSSSDTNIIAATDTAKGTSLYFVTNSSNAYYGRFTIRLNASSSVNIVAVKLEIGSVSTLANDVAPNYGTELLKCQRYFQRISSNARVTYGGFITSGALLYYFTIPLPTALRTVPTATSNSATMVIRTDNGYSNRTPNGTAAAINNPDISYANGLAVIGTSVQTAVDTNNIITQTSIFAGSLDLSAEL